MYQATVWVFANISGMITLRPNGTIHSLNENFGRLLFGYNRSELLGRCISNLIPDFFDLMDIETDPLPLPPLGDSDEEEQGVGSSLGERSSAGESVLWNVRVSRGVISQGFR